MLCIVTRSFPDMMLITALFVSSFVFMMHTTPEPSCLLNILLLKHSRRLPRGSPSFPPHLCILDIAQHNLCIQHVWEFGHHLTLDGKLLVEQWEVILQLSMGSDQDPLALGIILRSPGTTQHLKQKRSQVSKGHLRAVSLTRKSSVLSNWRPKRSQTHQNVLRISYRKKMLLTN